MLSTSYDVIVVGGGGGGLAAATSAAEHGASVLLLEKNPQLGGTTGIAIGSFTANRTSLQRKAGIEDDPDKHNEDAGKFAAPDIEARNNHQLRRFFLSHTSDTFDWLTGLGLSFYGPSPEPPNRAPRMHNVIPNAKAYIATLQARLLRLGGEIRCKAPVRDLLVENDCVRGVIALIDGREIEIRAAHGVVLATGDYANSAKIIARHKGEQFSQIEGIDETATGDGHLMAERIGARLVNMDVTYGPEIRFVQPPGKHITQILPASGVLAKAVARLVPLAPRFLVSAMIKRLLVTWQHPEDSLFDDGAVLVNSRGERFCDETAWPDREMAVANQPAKICYILLDERLMDRYSSWPHYISTAPEIAYAYVQDYLRLRADVAVSGSSLADVARQRALDPATLQAAVTGVNRAAYGEQPDAHGRSQGLQVLQGNSWVLLGPAKAYFTTTEGGIAVTERMQATRESGEPIEGLYAAGQVGLGGQVFWSHGLHIAWALTSGRLAGQNAAQA